MRYRRGMPNQAHVWSIAALCAVAAGCRQGPTAGALGPSETTAIAPAQSALFILKSAVELDGAGPIGAYVMSTNSGAVSKDAAVEYLQRTTKPTNCVAHRLADRLVVSCEPLAAPFLQHRPEFVSRMVSQTLSMVQETRQTRPGARLIELRVGDERRLLSLNAYQRLYDDYDLRVEPGSLMWMPEKAPEDSPDSVGAVETIQRGNEWSGRMYLAGATCPVGAREVPDPRRDSDSASLVEHAWRLMRAYDHPDSVVLNYLVRDSSSGHVEISFGPPPMLYGRPQFGGDLGISFTRPGYACIDGPVTLKMLQAAVRAQETAGADKRISGVVVDHINH
jgi:hypothetical protein